LLTVFTLFVGVAFAIACEGCGVACAAAGVGCPAMGSVGAVFGKDVHNGRLYVNDVPPGMAAAIAGLREGDEVLAIDAVPVGELSPQQVHKRLEGAVGTKVVLLIVRNGVTQRIELMRGARVAE
jgi:C-terminal processing protease CtpA/Prc